jgi:hypothetical protein
VLVGGDTGQSDPATAGPASTAASAVWKVWVGAAGEGVQDSTLLGPEGTTESRPEAVRLRSFSARHDLVFHTSHGDGVGGRRVGCGLVVG